MRKYCKAYKLSELRQFAGWTENPQEDGSVLNDDDICFIWDDFTVQAKSPFPEQGTLFNNVTPEWRAFCTDQLHFAIPDDLQYAYENDTDGSAQTVNAS
ncbi:MAG: hypothetical protein GFH27_549391n13 [Chloroflexi bacterium AL-W]|nr:hypothetical protein [Chloroflexi bacterium AL-N1]NOK71326.1 hypothetical protein [Chloroflexi bacterium AL-N10]NOK78672.1 hypothetical protein [Chloroflexi bacterium AL-N5]NOK85968.1 hypothetical protein [Chloroflexi bacterium AL-W]NOK93051.1 hypothetical protein [Chloroflexi bacterium AL-N15]